MEPVANPFSPPNLPLLPPGAVTAVSPPQQDDSRQKAKRAYDAVSKEVIMSDQAEKRDRTEAKREERAEVSLDSLLAAFQSCSINKTHFDPASLQRFFAKWRKELDGIMNASFSILRQLYQNSELTQQIEKLVENATHETKVLLNFHLGLYPDIRDFPPSRLAFSFRFLDSSDHLHAIFTEFLPNYAQEINEKQALVPIFALFSDISNESKAHLFDLQAVLESNDQLKIEEFRVNSLRNNRPSYAKLLDLFIRLDSMGKSYCLEILSAFAKFENEQQ